MENLFIEVAKFGYENKVGFSLADLVKGIGLQESTIKYRFIVNQMEIAISVGRINSDLLGIGVNEAGINDSLFIVMEFDSQDPKVNTSKFILNKDLYFSYIDHLELQHSLKTAEDAHKWAIRSLWITVLTSLISIVVSILQIIIKD